MNKEQYLASDHVRPFATWFGQNLTTGRFAHGWVDRKRRNLLRNFASVHDAFVQYHWPFSALPDHGIARGTTFGESVIALGRFKRLLRDATDDSQALHATTGVMQWGGVANGNVKWLRERANDSALLETLIETAKALAEGETANRVLTARTLRFNAGMTKVYSLMVPDFIIYDSRVAAAIGWAVVHYCTEHGLESVPPELAFGVRAAKEGPNPANPKSRNPSRGALHFATLLHGPGFAAWNLKASWLLVAALEAAKGAGESPFHAEANPLRALEAALFMIGYDLGGLDVGVRRAA